MNALASGFVASASDQHIIEYIQSSVRQRVLLGRMGEAEAEELGTPLLFLASDAGSFITGQTLVVDGGFSVL